MPPSRRGDVSCESSLSIFTPSQPIHLNSVAFNSSGMHIVTAGRDGTARVWDAENGIELAVLLGHTGPVEHAAWNNDGTRIVTASSDGTARVYYILLEDLLEASCPRAVRNMSEEEWNRFIVDDPYRETCPGKPVPGRDYEPYRETWQL